MSAAPAMAMGPPTNVCPQCGARFRCGMAGGDPECWCARLPAFLPVPLNLELGAAKACCLCPACLEAKLAAATQPVNVKHLVRSPL